MLKDFPQPGDSIALLLQSRTDQASHEDLNQMMERIHSIVDQYDYKVGTSGPLPGFVQVYKDVAQYDEDGRPTRGQFRYFVSAAIGIQGGGSGHGSFEIVRDIPLQGYEDIKVLACGLEKENNLPEGSIVILNWKLF